MAAGIACVAAAALVPLSTIHLAWRAHFAGPFLELWYEIAGFHHMVEGTATLADYVRPNNDHVLLFARALFAADLFLAGGRNVLTLWVTLLLQAGTCALLVREAARAPGFGPGARGALAGSYLILLFAAQQIENFVDPFQLDFVLSVTAAVAAVVCTADYQERTAAGRGGRGWLALAMVAALVAALSLANGLLAWGLMAVLLLTGPRRRGDVPAVLVGAAASLAVYLAITLGRERAALPDAAADPVAAALKAVLLLGSPFLATSRALAAILGTVGIGLAIGLGILVPRRFRALDRFARVHYAVLAYAFAAAVAYALLKRRPAVGMAGQSRYVSVALLFWVAMLGCAAAEVARLRRGRVPAAAALAAATAYLLLAHIVPGHRSVWPQVLETARFKRRAGLALIVGVPDRVTLDLFYDPDALQRETAFLRRRRASIFTPAWTATLGTPLAEAFPVDAGAACAGRFDATLPVYQLGVRRLAPRRGVRAEGWAGAGDDLPPDLIVLADDHGTIRGFARADGLPTDPMPAMPATPWRLPWFGHEIADQAGVFRGFHRPAEIPTFAEAPPAAKPPWRRTWFGYARPERAAVLRAYAVRDGVACPLAGRRFVGALATLPSAVPADAWTADGPWRPRACRPLHQAFAAGYALHFCPTRDARHGVLRSRPIETGDARFLVVPYLPGPRAAGLRLRALDPETGAPLADCPFPPQGIEWNTWTLDLAALGTSRVALEARVDAQRPADWLAIGEPRLFVD